MESSPDELSLMTVVSPAITLIEDDGTGKICTGGMRENPLGGKAGHAEQEVQTRADRDDAAAD
jgi:hypothetical protein